MSSININFEAADGIIKSLTDISSSINLTAHTAKTINRSFFEMCWGKNDALTSFQDSVSAAALDMENFKNEFEGIIKKYREAQENIKALVTGLSSTATASLDFTKYAISNVAKEKAEFILCDNGNVEEVKEISKNDMEAILIKRGATKDGNVYTFTMNGNTYGYNPSNNQLTLKGQPVGYYCKFFTTEDTNVDNVTNTVTILSGRDALNTASGPTGNPKSELFTGVKANDNSLIIVPYGDDPNYQKGAMAPCVSASTLIGDFIAGEDKNVSNGIIGYSYGGMVAYSTISQNEGLYDTFIHVDTYCPFYDKKYIDQMNYNSFKNMHIIMLEGDSYSLNPDYIDGSILTLKNFVENGVPKENIEVYSPVYELYSGAKRIIGEEGVHNIGKDATIMGTGNWYDHSRGMNIVRDGGLINYLSRDRGIYE